METQDMTGGEVARAPDGLESGIEIPKEYCEPVIYDEYDDEDNSFRGNRGRGNFRFVLRNNIFPFFV